MKVIIKHEDGRKVAVIDIGLVPKNHLLRKIDRSVNWNKIYEFVRTTARTWEGRVLTRCW